jgi:acylphosphatase
MGLRFSAMHKAHELNLKGYVQYTPNGDIVIETEGEEEALDQFFVWCQTGSISLLVSGIIINETELKGYTSFDIHHGFEMKESTLPKLADSAGTNPLIDRIRQFFKIRQ